MKNKNSQRLMAIFGCMIALGATWYGWFSVEPERQSSKPRREGLGIPDEVESFSGKRVTNVVSLADFEIDAGLEVAGVVINGEPRAYLLDGMKSAENHIAHDSVGGESVSVAYCPWLSTARCVVIPEKQQDQFKVVGWINQTFQLAYQTNQFSIEADTLPLPELEVTITSIADWRRRYPNSKVYLGDIPRAMAPARQHHGLTSERSELFQQP